MDHMSEAITQPVKEVIEESANPFHISIDHSITPRELLSLSAEGRTSVQRTPHVGNANLSHLAHFTLGLPAILYDRNKGLKDQNFNPDGVVSSEGYEQMAHPDLLISHATVISPPSKEFHGRDRWFQPGHSIAEAHTSALQELFPDTDIRHYTHYLAENDDLARRVLEVAQQVLPASEIWTRRVNGEGETTSTTPQGGENPLEDVYGITNQEHGWVVSNKLNVLLAGVIEAARYGTDKIYHISGPDMHKYIGKMQGDMNTLYSAVQAALPDSMLPRQLEFVVVPMADVRFAVQPSKAAFIDELVSMWGIYEDLEAQRKAFYSQLYASEVPHDIRDEAKRDFVAEKEAPVYSHIQQLARSCPEIFFDTKDRRYVTQYDMLDGYGRSLHIPSAILDMPVGDIARMYKTYKKIANSKRDY
jgi:hypothetical protein